MPKTLPAYIHPKVQEALDHFEVSEFQQLAEKLNMGQSTIVELAQLPESVQIEFCTHCNSLRRIRKPRSA